MGHLIKKITKAKRNGSVAQVVEHLYGKCKALSSNPVPQNKQKTKKTQKLPREFHGGKRIMAMCSRKILEVSLIPNI
jgi:hypothetical protein